MVESKEESLGEYSKRDYNSDFKSSALITTQSTPQGRIFSKLNAGQEISPVVASTRLSESLALHYIALL